MSRHHNLHAHQEGVECARTATFIVVTIYIHARVQLLLCVQYDIRFFPYV